MQTSRGGHDDVMCDVIVTASNSADVLYGQHVTCDRCMIDVRSMPRSAVAALL